MTIPTPSELETFAFNLIKDQDQAKVIVEKVFGLLKKKEAIKTDADKRAFLYKCRKTHPSPNREGFTKT